MTQVNRKESLRGLLLDLEFGLPEPSRYSELRQVFTQELSSDPALSSVSIDLDYVHFTEFAISPETAMNYDFVILSPQGTPWRKYVGDAAQALEMTKAHIRNLAVGQNKPIIGICGGHQFLALAFGGKVDYIDPQLMGTYTEKYTREALSEKGLTSIKILDSDPIFAGMNGGGVFNAMESHYEEVKQVPEPFVNLASSRLSEAQLIRIPGKIVYGAAFHPERKHENRDGAMEFTDAKRILINFVRLLTNIQTN